MCHRLADAGADIVALSAVAADLDATQAEVEQRGQQCASAVVDVHDLETLRSTIENHPEVDLVVNVVGGVTVPYWHRLHDYPIESSIISSPPTFDTPSRVARPLPLD